MYQVERIVNGIAQRCPEMYATKEEAQAARKRVRAQAVQLFKWSCNDAKVVVRVVEV